MKKLWVVAMVLVVAAAFGQEAKQPKFSIGLDSLTFSWVSANANGEVISSMGINMALGVSYRSYITPLAVEKGSTYWEVGTILLIDPYVSGGYDYRINETLYVGGGIMVFPLHPFLLSSYGGYSLFYTVSPTIHVGVYLF